MKTKLLPLLLLIVILMSFAPEKRQWVAIGDSITYLNDHPEQTGNRITKGYMTLITQEHPELNFVNQGHNGWTAVKIAEKIETLNIVKADVYTVFWVPTIGGKVGLLVRYKTMKTAQVIILSLGLTELL
jgi:hypothetical protein